MDSSFLTYALTVFTGFFAIMNPLANAPVFIGLTDGMDTVNKRSVARKSVITAFFIVVVFVFIGKYIFELFGITIPAFKIAGGILIFYVGFEMLMSKKSSIHNTKEDTDQDEGIAISPLAIPILAGPGTIVTAMNFVTDASYIHIGIVVAVFALMILLTWLAFIYSDVLLKKIGNNNIVVITKLMGLILTIIGTDMLISGIKLSFHLG
jgi:multiple antibiotic resistance protein